LYAEIGFISTSFLFTLSYIVIVIVGSAGATTGAPFNRIQAIASILKQEKGSFFYGGVSPSKIGLSAPSLEREQLRSNARVFLPG
jgi:hypothetical protein